MNNVELIKDHSSPSQAIDARRVLVADDDTDLSKLLEFALQEAGLEVEVVDNGKAALQAVKRSYFSLLLLDIEMPEVNGLVVCKRVRELSKVPILVLSARNQESDLINALDAGADGFITKPFSPRALLARIHALLRRAADTAADSSSVSQQIELGLFRLDIEERMLQTRRHKIVLTRLETIVLKLLMESANRSVESKLLVAEAWGPFNAGNRNMLKQVIFRIRRKLEVDADALQALVTTADGYSWEVAVVTGNQATVENSTAYLY